MGVIYYKHESVYSGDTTVDRSLRCDEVDGNFFFLRGYDLSTVGVDSETNELVLTRVNGEKIRVDISQPVSNVQMSFDRETGTLKVKTPNGTQEITGFLTVDSGINVASDSTISGKGTMTDPIRVSATELTGTFAAADEFRDLSESNGTLTKEDADGEEGHPALKKGYRIVTFENVTLLGLLYNYDSVKSIQEALETSASQWRVPTKDDWDKMLNSIEREDDCESSVRDHNSTISNKLLGAAAGKKLKSVGLWNESVDAAKGIDAYGFTVLPAGYIEDTGVENDIREYAAFWTSTVEDNDEDMWIKRFEDGQTKVRQSSWSPAKKLSLRLVKDYDGNNYYQSEYIDGINMTIPCVHMEDSKTIWTQVNVSAAGFGGVTSSKWDNFSTEERGNHGIYLLNEWDGKKWIKRQMLDGQSIVLRNFEDPEQGMVHYHEYIVVSEDGENFELRDTVSNIKGEIQDRLDVIDENIETLFEGLSAETAERIEKDEALENVINEEVARATSAETELREDLDAEIARAISAETDINNNLEIEVLRAQDAEAALQSNIDAEVARATSAETELHEDLDAEIARATEIEAGLRSDLNDEITRAQAKENQLQESLDSEIARATAKENEIEAALEAEVTRATNAENELDIALGNEIVSAREAEEQLRNDLAAENARALAAEAVLKGRDINDSGHTFKVEEGLLKLVRENGDEVSIALDTNFGTLPKFE